MNPDFIHRNRVASFIASQVVNRADLDLFEEIAEAFPDMDAWLRTGREMYVDAMDHAVYAGNDTRNDDVGMIATFALLKVDAINLTLTQDPLTQFDDIDCLTHPDDDLDL